MIDENTLTERELDVVACILVGNLSYKTTATLLGISYKTVDSYLRRAYTKLDVTNKYDFKENIDFQMLQQRYTEINSLHNIHTPNKTYKNHIIRGGITFLGISLVFSLLYKIYYPEKLIDHVSSMTFETEMTQNSRAIVKHINTTYNKQRTDLKLLILAGAQKSERTYYARKFSAEKKYALRTEINAENETELYNSLYSIAKLLVMNDSVLDEQLGCIHSLPNTSIRKIELINFIFSALQCYKNWIIIIDNVDDIKNINIIISIAKSFISKGTLLFTVNNKNKINNSEFIIDIDGNEEISSEKDNLSSVEQALELISLAIFKNENIKAKQKIAELNQRTLSKTQKTHLLIFEAILQMKLGHCAICTELLEYALKVVSSVANSNEEKSLLKADIIKLRAFNRFLNHLNTSDVYNCIAELNAVFDILSNCKKTQYMYTELIDLLSKRSEMLISVMKYKEALKDLERAESYIHQLESHGLISSFYKAKIRLDKGHIFLRTGRISEAAEYYANAKKLMKEIQSTDYIFKLLEQESEILIRLGKLNAAEENCKQIIADHNLFDNPYNSIFICTTYYNMAIIQYKKRNFEQSRYYFFRFFINAEQYISKTFPEKIEWFLKNKAKFHDTSSIINCLKNSLEIFQTICIPDSEFITEYVNVNYIEAKKNNDLE